MYRRVFFANSLLLCAALATFVGCGPSLNLNQQMAVEPNDIRTIVIDAIDQEQVIQVSATSSEPVHVHVYLPKDEAAVDASITLGKEPAEALAGGLNKKDHTLSATVPANQEARVRIQSASGNKANVTLKVTN